MCLAKSSAFDRVTQNKTVIKISNLKLERGRVGQLTYVAYARTPNFIGIRMILDMSTLTCTLIFSLLFCKVFKFFWFL